MREMAVPTLDDLKILAARVLAEVVRPRAKRAGATVLALHGELGAGKTTFVQRIAERVGVVEQVTSPTFVIMRLYPIKRHDLFKTLVHIDAYRIESLDEMRVIGFADTLREPTNLLCIEWAERIETIVPKDAFHITLTHPDVSPSNLSRMAVYG